jgi:beta-glucosidase
VGGAGPQVNETYACENKQTLTKDFKETMGFKGFIMSDWGATHSTVDSANGGLDQQMPDDSYFGSAMQAAIASGEVPQSRLDDMVYRILNAMISVGILDQPQTGDLGKDARSDERTAVARRLAIEATVLVKNEGGLLPLDPSG